MNEATVLGGQEVVGVGRIEGPIVIVEGATNVSYDEVVEIRDSRGHLRRGRVLEVGEGTAVIQVFAGSISHAIALATSSGVPMRPSACIDCEDLSAASFCVMRDVTELTLRGGQQAFQILRQRTEQTADELRALTQAAA